MPVEPDSGAKEIIETTPKQQPIETSNREVEDVIESRFRDSTTNQQHDNDALTGDVRNDEDDSSCQQWYTRNLPQQDRDNLDSGINLIIRGAVDLMLHRIKEKEIGARNSKKRVSTARAANIKPDQNGRQLRSHSQNAPDDKVSAVKKSNVDNKKKSSQQSKSNISHNKSEKSTKRSVKVNLTNSNGSRQNASTRRQATLIGRDNNIDHRRGPSTEFHGNHNRWPSPTPNMNYRLTSNDGTQSTSVGYGVVHYGPYQPGPPIFHHIGQRQHFSQHPAPTGPFANQNPTGVLLNHFHPTSHAAISHQSNTSHHHSSIVFENDRSRYYERDQDSSRPRSTSLGSTRRGPGSGEYDETYAYSNRSRSESQSRAYSAGHQRSPSRSPPYYTGGVHYYGDHYRDGYDDRLGSNYGRVIGVENSLRPNQKRPSLSSATSDDEYADERHRRPVPVVGGDRHQRGRRSDENGDNSPRITRSRTKEALEGEQVGTRQPRNSIPDADREYSSHRSKPSSSDGSDSNRQRRKENKPRLVESLRSNSRGSRSSSTDESYDQRRRRRRRDRQRNKKPGSHDANKSSGSQRRRSTSSEYDDSRDSSYQNHRSATRRKKRRHTERHNRIRRERDDGDDQSSGADWQSNLTREQLRSNESPRKRGKKDRIESSILELQK